MRTLPPSLLLLGLAAALPAQVVTFKSGERWEVNSPFQLDAKGQPVVDAKKARFMADFGLTDYDANVLTADLDPSSFFEAVAQGRDGKMAANWVINELFGRLNKEGRSIADTPLSAAQLGGVIDLIASGEISGKMAKDLFEGLWTEGGDPAEVAAASEIVILMLPDTPDVEKVLFGPGGVAEGVQPGAVVINMSSISPAAEPGNAARLAAKGVEYLDAPVSGGDLGAIADAK